MTLFIMVWKVINTLIISIWNVDNREFVQSCPALVWKIPVYHPALVVKFYRVNLESLITLLIDI